MNRAKTDRAWELRSLADQIELGKYQGSDRFAKAYPGPGRASDPVSLVYSAQHSLAGCAALPKELLQHNWRTKVEEVQASNPSAQQGRPWQVSLTTSILDKRAGTLMSVTVVASGPQEIFARLAAFLRAAAIEADHAAPVEDIETA